MKRFSTLLICALLLICLGADLLCHAANEEAAGQIELLAVAYRGNAAAAPANSLEAVLAAADAGADYISVEVTKTADGVFVLLTDAQKQALANAVELTAAEMQTALFGGLSSQKIPTLAEVKEALGGRAGLILDFDWNDRKALCDSLKEQGIESDVLLRTAAPAKEILRFWQEEDASAMPLGVYRGNVIFQTLSHLKKLSGIGAPIVQYQSKNYFNVAFGGYAAWRFRTIGGARLMAATYDEMLCGRRKDGVAGWEELVGRGYTVLETSCIKELIAYQKQRESCKAEIQSALQTNGEIPAQTRQTAEEALLPGATLSARQTALSILLQAPAAIGEPSKTQSDEPGVLRVTPGKVIAIVLCGAAAVAWQVFVHKMQRKKEKTN